MCTTGFLSQRLQAAAYTPNRFQGCQTTCMMSQVWYCIDSRIKINDKTQIIGTALHDRTARVTFDAVF